MSLWGKKKKEEELALKKKNCHTLGGKTIKKSKKNGKSRHATQKKWGTKDRLLWSG